MARNVALILFLMSAGSLWAQTKTEEVDYPKVEIFGGYSHAHRVGENLSLTGNLNDDFNGWEASANYNLNRWFGIKGDLTGQYNRANSITLSSQAHHYDFVLGPQLSWRLKQITVFGHGLVGFSHQF